MKRYISIFLYTLYVNILFAQSNASKPMDFYIVKEVIPAVLNVIPGTLQFIDQNNNNVIDANEKCNIRFQIQNSGHGEGHGCIARTECSGTTQGISISEVRLPIIPAEGKYWVEIPISANANTQTGKLALDIVVNEPNGYSTDNIHYAIGTHKLETPYITVASHNISGTQSGVLERRKPFYLQIIVQNIDQGVAENVSVNIKLPNNVNRYGGTAEHTIIPTLKAGESDTLTYELIANQDASEQINIQIALSEKQGRYAKSAIIPLHLGQYVSSSHALYVERHDHAVEIKQNTLISEVDQNIPVTNIRNANTFAVIIANENYQSVAPVPFALNDGNVFREYCLKTLGIPEKQIKYVPNATGNQIKAQVNWLQTICEVFEDAQIIFYYAGHGIPDESSRTAYLLPVDGIGTDISTGYKLDDLYSALGNIPAKNVTVFMDACFSGSKRESGMLASARGVAIKARSGMPQGNMVVFSAAQGDETAYPNNEERHGMFTYFLLKKLQDTKGDVTLQELGEYITKNVSQQSILLNGKSQTPCVTPSASLDASWREWKLK